LYGCPKEKLGKLPVGYKLVRKGTKTAVDGIRKGIPRTITSLVTAASFSVVQCF